MTWSFQLTVWALPPLLGALVITREAQLLWPRRRERGATALLVLLGVTGVWAALDLLAVVSPPLDLKLLWTRVQYVPAAAAPVAWAAFILVLTRQKKELRRWPMVLLYLVAAAPAGLTLHPDGFALLVRGAGEVEMEGWTGLVLDPGPAHWALQGVQLVTVLVATRILSRYLAGIPGSRGRQLAVAGSVSLVVAAILVHDLTEYGAQWQDPSAPAFALGAAFLGWGLLRQRLLNLGPVARTLVMVELRDPIAVVDARGRIVDVNRAAERELGLEAYGDVPLALGTMWARAWEDRGTPLEVSLEVDGEERVFEVTMTPLDDRGAPGRTVLVFRDVTARHRMEQQLRESSETMARLANTDSLTGLANRRRFMEALDQEVERSHRYRRSLSLVMLDLDHFKDVNDTYGHPAGDEVLRSTADVLRSVSREIDLPARIGGEELALLLPETDPEGARVVAERVRERMEAVEHESPQGEPFTVTGSLGVATLSGDEMDQEGLLHVADRALYDAKEAGRNRVMVGSEGVL